MSMALALIVGYPAKDVKVDPDHPLVALCFQIRVLYRGVIMKHSQLRPL